LINVKHVLRFLALLHGKYGFVKYFRPEFENFEKANQETDFALIRNALIKATKKTNSRCSYWCLTVRRFRLFFDNGYSCDYKQKAEKLQSSQLV
jgi:hypothetical protein